MFLWKLFAFLSYLWLCAATPTSTHVEKGKTEPNEELVLTSTKLPREIQFQLPMIMSLSSGKQVIDEELSIKCQDDGADSVIGPFGPRCWVSENGKCQTETSTTGYLKKGENIATFRYFMPEKSEFDNMLTGCWLKTVPSSFEMKLLLNERDLPGLPGTMRGHSKSFNFDKNIMLPRETLQYAQISEAEFTSVGSQVRFGFTYANSEELSVDEGCLGKITTLIYYESNDIKTTNSGNLKLRPILVEVDYPINPGYLGGDKGSKRLLREIVTHRSLNPEQLTSLREKIDIIKREEGNNWKNTLKMALSLCPCNDVCSEYKLADVDISKSKLN